MADRVPASIRIGGALPHAHLATLVAEIEAETLVDGLGEYFRLDHINGEEPLDLSANEVAWGRFEKLEAFCVEHGLPFARWCGSYPGGWEAERVVFDGTGEPRSYLVTENDHVVLGHQDIRALGSLEAIEAHFASADIPVPALSLTKGESDRGR